MTTRRDSEGMGTWGMKGKGEPIVANQLIRKGDLREAVGYNRAAVNWGLGETSKESPHRVVRFGFEGGFCKSSQGCIADTNEGV